MANCPECGVTINSDHEFCLNCGAELPGASTSGTTDAAPPSEAPTWLEPQVATQKPVATEPARRAKPRRTRKSASDTTLPPLVALVLSLALQQVINSVVPPEAYLHRLFRPQGGWIMSIVPALIAFVFIWTIVDLLLKYRVARVNEADLARSDVNQVPNLVRQESAGAVQQRLRTWEISLLARPVGRRVHWLLQHLGTVDAQRAHELARHQADLESDTAASGYRAVRLFIWAMPILGFIGTVLGISLAVGGFSDFLTTNVSIDEIDRVTAELGNVASGLSFAFDTTLLGLLAGLVASVASSAVQSKEERFLTGLEELGLRIMESAQPAEASTRHDTGAVPGAEFDEMMRSRLQELSLQMKRFTQAVRSGLDGFLEEWGELPPEVARVTADLAELREHLGAAAKGADAMLVETSVLLRGLKEASTSVGTQLQASIGSISETVDGLGASLGGVSDTLEASLSGFGASLGSVSGTLEASLAGLSERVQDSQGHLTAGLASLSAGLTRLKETVEESRRDDQAMGEALERLSGTITALSGTLGTFHEAQAAMMPLLSKLSGPLELRLAPSPLAVPKQR
jgi:biopolymer transport protein ExbB/TolQ